MSPRLLVWMGWLALPGVSVVHGQVVQLPTFRYFSVQTSVLAPDSGGAYLGGVGRAASGRTSRGTPGGGRLFGNRSIEHSVGASRSSVHATVIDLEELDRAVLAEAARRRPAGSPADIHVATIAQNRRGIRGIQGPRGRGRTARKRGGEAAPECRAAFGRASRGCETVCTRRGGGIPRPIRCGTRLLPDGAETG